jgi:hypothetical protein
MRGEPPTGRLLHIRRAATPVDAFGYQGNGLPGRAEARYDPLGGYSPFFAGLSPSSAASDSLAYLPFFVRP